VGWLALAWGCGAGDEQAASDGGDQVPAEAGDADGASDVEVADVAPGLDGVADAASAGQPKIVVVPTSLQFGTVEMGEQRVRMFKIANAGTAPLKVYEVAILNFDDAVLIQLSEVGPWSLAPGQSVSLQAALAPLKSLPDDGSPAGQLTVYSDDPNNPLVVVKLFARTKGMKLAVTPADIVDFGIVPLASSVEMLVTVANLGDVNLAIQKVVIAGDPQNEFELVAKSAAGLPPWNPADPEVKALILKGGDSNQFGVRFKAKGPVGKVVSAELAIHSTSVVKPIWKLTLLAMRAKSKACFVELQSQELHFGVIGFGASTTRTLTVKNVGDGYCSLDDKIAFLPCPTSSSKTIPGAPLAQSKPICKAYGEFYFSVFAASPLLNKLGPGQSGDIQVEFKASLDPNHPNFLPVTGLPYPFWSYGFVALKFRDMALGPGAGMWFPADPTGGGEAAKLANLKPNLKAGVAASAVVALPASIDFGTVPTGCKSSPLTVHVHNNEPGDAFITGAKLAGCGLAVQKVGWPSIPKSGIPVTPVTPTPFTVQYAPQAPGAATCAMELTTGLFGSCGIGGADCDQTSDCPPGVKCSGLSFAIPLAGAATDAKVADEYFPVEPGPPVDLLFVVNNSVFMKPYHAKLAASVGALIGPASPLAASDVHVGVISTDMTSVGHKGQLQPLVDGVRVLSKATAADPVAALAKLVKVGGPGSATEQGLAAAGAALTLPLIHDAGKTCLATIDCTAGGQCLTGGDGKKGCGGTNRGFLRKTAALEVIFVSVQDDKSSGTEGFYANLLASLKIGSNKGPFHAHAIVGLPGDVNCPA